MPETFKIGVVYRDRTPQLFTDLAPEATPWQFEFFRQQAILGGPVKPGVGFLAVFFNYQEDDPGLSSRLSNIFPGAEIIGFENSDGERPGGPAKTAEGLLVVQLPMTFS